MLPSKPEGYELGKKIGNRGWKASVAEQGADVVVKSIAFDVTKNPAKTATVEQALEHFKALSHAHMVKSLHSFYVDKELWVIEDTRGWEDSTVRSLSPAPQPLGEPALAALARPVLLALQCLHASGRAGSDLRGKNLFVQRDGPVLINPLLRTMRVSGPRRSSAPHRKQSIVTGPRIPGPCCRSYGLQPPTPEEASGEPSLPDLIHSDRVPPDEAQYARNG